MMENHSRFIASNLIILLYPICDILRSALVIVILKITKAIFSSTVRKRSDRQNQRDCGQQNIDVGNNDNNKIDIDSEVGFATTQNQHRMDVAVRSKNQKCGGVDKDNYQNMSDSFSRTECDQVEGRGCVHTHQVNGGMDREQLVMKTNTADYNDKEISSNVQHENGRNMKINLQFEDKWCTKLVHKYYSHLFHFTQLAKDTTYAECDRSFIYEPVLPIENTYEINVYILESLSMERYRDPPIPQRHPLHNEWSRFVSFIIYEGGGNVFQLARHGFYHDQQHGETWTSCIFCSVEFEDWVSGDNVQEKHPDCPMYTQTSHNIPIHVMDNQMNRGVNRQRETERESPASTRRGQIRVEFRQPFDGTSGESTGTSNRDVPRERINCQVVEGAFLHGGSQPSASDDMTCERNVVRREDGHFNRRDVCRHGGDGNRQNETERRFNAIVADPTGGPVVDLKNNVVEPRVLDLHQPAFGLDRTFNQRDLQMSLPPRSANRRCVICGVGPASVLPCGHFDCYCKRCQPTCPHCVNS